MLMLSKDRTVISKDVRQGEAVAVWLFDCGGVEIGYLNAAWV